MNGRNVGDATVGASVGGASVGGASVGGASVGGAGRVGRLPVAAVVSTACRGCGACLLTCPERAFRPVGADGLVVLAALCTACGECAEVCPADAIVIEEGCVD